MHARLSLLLLILLAGASSSVLALQMPIYEGTAVLAAGQDEQDDGALRAALTNVLMKVSGDRSVTTDAGLGSVLGDARRIALTVTTRTLADGTRLLVANFDPGAVHDRLATLGRPVWHDDRPPVLVWLGIDDGNQKQIASANQIAALSAMTGRAQQRGLPILLPRMDAVDQNRINPVTLWGAPAQTILAAGQRYGVQTMLVIRLSRGMPWRARYTLIDGRNTEEWEQSDAQSNALLGAAIDGATDRMARRYAVERQGSSIGSVDWWIDGIRSPQDYAAAAGYLQRLEFIRDLRVLRAEGESLQVHLDLAVGERRLRQLLAIDGRIELLDAQSDRLSRLRLVH
ncbi:MAG: DUF2066 domain-containing protein [Rhodanobacteraceae bacterium]|nr:DUF2066 domain-containing protein [Rhodanobacteraceae bacterium]MBP9153597.1 DUF2066 domain-containing protein [Xanthomonadales bacterium]